VGDEVQARSGLQGRVPAARTGSCTEGCAACCQSIVLQVNPQYGQEEEVRRWIELHGIRIEQYAGACWATVPMPCSALTPEGKCSLYGHEDRPKTCEFWPVSQSDIDKLEKPEVCTYRFERKA
jgi:hypothetical protein